MMSRWRSFVILPAALRRRSEGSRLCVGGDVTRALGINSQGSITFGQPQSGAAAWHCALTSGSVVVTSLSSARVRGSFSGSGSCLPSTGSPVAFTVTNGSFDVPLVDIAGL
jgi:hypothetical protein